MKIKKIASGSSLSSGFFIVMDRLYETLKERMGDWKDAASESRGMLGFRSDKGEMKRIMLERLIVAHDLALAFWYFHENR